MRIEMCNVEKEIPSRGTSVTLGLVIWMTMILSCHSEIGRDILSMWQDIENAEVDTIRTNLSICQGIVSIEVEAIRTMRGSESYHLTKEQTFTVGNCQQQCGDFDEARQGHQRWIWCPDANKSSFACSAGQRVISDLRCKRPLSRRCCVFVKLCKCSN